MLCIRGVLTGYRPELRRLICWTEDWRVYSANSHSPQEPQNPASEGAGHAYSNYEMKLRVFALESLVLSTCVSIKRGGGGLTLKAGQDQAKAWIERQAFDLEKELQQSEIWKSLPEPKHLTVELFRAELSDLASRVGHSNG